MNGAGEAAERLAAFEARIAEACRLAKRQRGEVQLVAVSKTFAAEAIVPFLAAGHRVFGENRVQEARDKWPALRERYPGVELHLIGPLQTNKVRDALRLFDVIETLDRDALAVELAREMHKLGRSPRLYVQVNTGEESQKAGIAPRDALAFIGRCRDAYGLPISGLMCIPPSGEPPGPHFALLDTLAAEAGLQDRSMGMSADFEAAILCGATHIRIGTALFGSR